MGQITGKDNNRVPTVKECNDAYGGNYMTESQVAEAISEQQLTFNLNRFQNGVRCCQWIY